MDISKHKVGILVLCTGNSCRSQIAAAYLDRFAGDLVEVLSAGTAPDEDIHPLTHVVLAEDGIDLGTRTPNDYRDFLGRISPYYLILVCNGAVESCPSTWPGVRETLLWPFDDPSRAVGSYAERLDRFRQVRDEIKLRVATWVAERFPAPVIGPHG